jgi:fatty acid desaturase
MSGMEQEIITPPATPKADSHAFSPLGCFLAAAGATLMTLSLLGAAAAATVWAFVKLLGFPDTVLYVALAIAMIPVLWATVWTAGRAWHVEQLLARSLDVDTPVFKLGHYFKGAR